MTSHRREIILTRSELRALLDSCDPALTPAASQVWERLLDVEHASAEIAIVVPAVSGEPSP